MSTFNAIREQISRNIVKKYEPEEYDVFDDLAVIYYDNPTPPSVQSGLGGPNSAGIGDPMLFITPAVIAAVTTILTHLQNPSGIAETYSFSGLISYEHGIRQMYQLLRPAFHPQLQSYEARFAENLHSTRLYGEDENRLAQRAELVAHLNTLARQAELSVSFNQLCGLGLPYDAAKQAASGTAAAEIAGKFGVEDDVVSDMVADIMDEVIAKLAQMGAHEDG